MEKTIEITETQLDFNELAEEVKTNDDKYIVKKNGQPIAALVPMEVLQYWNNGRNGTLDKKITRSERLQAILEKAQANSDLEPEEAERLAVEEVKAMRAERKARANK